MYRSTAAMTKLQECGVQRRIYSPRIHFIVDHRDLNRKINKVLHLFCAINHLWNILSDLTHMLR